MTPLCRGGLWTGWRSKGSSRVGRVAVVFVGIVVLLGWLEGLMVLIGLRITFGL